MKNFFLGFLLFAITIGTFSCDPADNYALSARINGQLWVSEKGVAAYMGSQALVMNALSNTKPSMALSIKSLSVGTHPLDSINNGFLYTFQGDQQSGHYATTAHPGELVISEHDTAGKYIKGSFRLVAYNYLNGDSIRVEEGRFEINYQ